MGTQKMSGLTKRGGIWHIDKVFRGTRIRESTGTGEIVKAQELLAKRIEEIRAAQLYGVRPDRTFRVAATKFLKRTSTRGVSTTMRCTWPNSIPSSGTCFSGKCTGQPAAFHRQPASGWRQDDDDQPGAGTS